MVPIVSPCPSSHPWWYLFVRLLWGFFEKYSQRLQALLRGIQRGAFPKFIHKFRNIKVALQCRQQNGDVVSNGRFFKAKRALFGVKGLGFQGQVTWLVRSSMT